MVERRGVFRRRVSLPPSFLWKEVPVGRRLDDAKHRKIDFADLNWNERYLISNPWPLIPISHHPLRFQKEGMKMHIRVMDSRRPKSMERQTTILERVGSAA